MSRFGRAADFGQDREDGVGLELELSKEERVRLAVEERAAKEAALQEEREAALKALNERHDEAAAEAEALARDSETQLQKQRQLDVALENETNRTEELMAAYRLKKQALALLRDRDKSMAELQGKSAEAARGLLELAAEWERHRVPLIEALRGKKAELDKRRGDMQRKIERVREMRAEMRDLVEEVKRKDELAKSLVQEYEAMPKAVQRGGYTRRINEIVRNVDKQKRDIESILADTRGIQKDINTNVETLNRSYGAADELIYKDAQKGDAAAKRMYRQLVGMHECFEKLTKTIEETGSTSNQIRDLELKIEQEHVRANVLNMDTVLGDLKEIRAENAALRARLGGRA